MNPFLDPYMPRLFPRATRRSQDDYADSFSKLLPLGIAWPRQEDSLLMRCVFGFAGILGARMTGSYPIELKPISVDGRAADLLERESDPRLTSPEPEGMLPDW